MRKSWVKKVVVCGIIVLLSGSCLTTLFSYTLKASTVTQINSGVSSPLCDVDWKPDGSYALICGDNGVLLKYSGGSITPLSTGTSHDLYDIAWHPVGAIYQYALIVGEGGVYRYDHSTGNFYNIYSSTYSYHALSWVLDEDGQYIALIIRKSNGQVLTYDGVEFTEVCSQSSALAGADDLAGGASTVWPSFAAVTSGGPAVSTWSPDDPCGSSSWYSPDHCFAVDYQIDYWYTLAVGTDSSEDDVVVGRYYGSSWTTIPTGYEGSYPYHVLYDVKFKPVSQSNFALICGNYGFLLEYHLNCFSQVTTPTQSDLYALDWKLDGSCALIVGANGKVLYYVYQLEPLEANAGPNQSCMVGQSISFSGDNTKGGLPPYQWDWNFGDGQHSPIKNPTHTYTSQGTYTVTLTVTDFNGAIDSDIATVYISQELIANEGDDLTGTVGIPLQFQGSATGGFPPYQWDWNFGDGSPHSQEQNPEHTYTSEQTYTATLTVSDSQNNIAWDQIQVTIEEPFFDLTIDKIEFEPQNPLEGEPTWIKARIYNKGNFDFSGNTEVSFYESASFGSYSLIGSIPINNLRSGSKTWVAIGWNAIPIYNSNNEDIRVDVEASGDGNPDNNANTTQDPVYDTSPFDSFPDGFSFSNWRLGEQENFLEQIKGYLKASFGLEYISFLWLTPLIYAFTEKAGHCYGMAATSIFYFQYPELKSSTKSTFNLSKSEAEADITAYQMLQIPVIAKNLIADIKELYNERNEYEVLKANNEQGIPMLLSMHGTFSSPTGPVKAGHSVVAMNTYSVSNDIKNVIIYDNNKPGRTVLCKFDLSENKFYYPDGICLRAIVMQPFPSSSDICKIILYELLNALNNRLTITVACSVNVTITNQEGMIINDDEINEIPGADADITNDVKVFYLPINSTYTINVSAVNIGLLNFTKIIPINQNNLSFTGFTNISLTENSDIHIDLQPNITNYTMEIDYNGDGEIDEIKSNDINASFDVRKPLAYFSYSPSELIVNESIKFDGSLSFHDPKRNATYIWDFGDGTTGTGEIINHTYNSPGTFTVNLTILDNESYNNSINKTIKIVPRFVWVDNDFTSSTPGWNITHFNKIQKSIEEVCRNGTVYVSNGNYNEKPIINKTMHLLGEDRNNTIIDGSGVGDVIHVSADDVEICGFTIRNSGSSHDENFYDCDAGIDLRSNNSTITNNIITQNGFIGILLRNSSHNNITNNIIENNDGNGIDIAFSCNDNNLSGNIILMNRGNGISFNHSSNNNTISLNLITNNNGSAGILCNESVNNLIHRNWFKNHTGRGILFLASTSDNYVYLNNFVNNTQHAYDTNNNNIWYSGELQQGNYWDDLIEFDQNGNGIADGPYWLYVDNYDFYPLMYPWYPNHPDTVYVDDDYSIVTDGFGYDHFNMIQYAVREATGNAVVFVSSGIYDEYSIAISKSTQLIGENRNTTIIHSDFAINIFSNNVYVSNFSIDGSHNEGPYCGIYTTGSNTIIRNCTITSFDTYGLFVGFSGDTIISNCIISNCPSGIILWVGYSTIISNCIISNCNKGIYIFWNGSYYNIIRNCSFIGNAYGIYAYGSWGNVIYHNNFVSNTHNAYESWGNTWDNGYPSGGNYWDDYLGIDSNHGPNQDILGFDRIGDTKYSIYGGSKKDNYPLIEPWTNQQHPPIIPNTPTPANGTTNISLDSILSWFCIDLDGDALTYDVYFGTTNPPSKTMENQSLVIFDPETLNQNTTYYWKIVAWDTHGASTAGSLWQFTTNLGNIPIKNLSLKWNFVSLPFNQSVDKTNLLVKYNAVEYSWQEAVNQNIIVGFIYAWNRTNQNYLLTNTLVPGEGYWMYAYHNCELSARGVNNFESDTYITDLLLKWNLIGSPNDEPVEKQDLMIRYNGMMYTWQDAVANTIILGFIYQWNETGQSYQLTDVLQPGKSYWIYAYYNCILLRPTI